MRVAFEGWQRNHGLKVMLDQKVKSEHVTDNPWPLQPNDFKVKTLNPTDDSIHGVKLLFHTEMRLGGAQLGVITLSRSELILLLRKCVGDMTLTKFAELFEAA